MNPFFDAVGNPASSRLGWALLHSLWQGALIGVVFGLCRIALKNCSSNARYLSGCLALATMLGAPAVTFLWTTMSVTYGEYIASRFESVSDAGVLAAGDAAVPRFGGTEAFMRGGADWLSQAAPWVVVLWLIGVTFFSIRLMRSCRWVRTIRTTANEAVDERFIIILNHLRQRLGVSQPVRLLKSALVEVPTVVGWLRPVILMPAATLAGLTPRQLEAILAHELAHVRRFDYLVNAFQCLVETLMFYHPIVWWVSRVVREEREHCCDDLVISVCGDRLAYARALATLEGSRSGLPQFAFAASGGSLTNRIRRLFGLPADESSRTRYGGLVLIGIGAVLIILGACLFVMPKTYRAMARVKIERNFSNASQNDGVAQSNGSFDPYFIQTELEVIQSEFVLGRVVALLNLANAWSEKYGNGTSLGSGEVVGMLRNRVELRAVPNASIVQISACSDNPTEAASIANGIAEAYRDCRLETSRQFTLAAMSALDDQYKEQEEKVRNAQEELGALRKQLGINDSGGDGSTPASDTETLRQLEASRVQAETELTKERATLDQLRKLSHEDLINVLPTTVPDSSLTSLIDLRNQLSIRLVEVQNQYGRDHPDYRGVKNQLDTANQKLDERARGILLGIETKVKTVEAQLKQLCMTVDASKARSRESVEAARPYYEKKRNLEELMRYRQIVTLKAQSDALDASSAKPALATIVDRAVRPRHPSSPNRTLAGALIAFGVFLDLAGLLVVSSGRRANVVQPA
jgi:uncharacterized protein involved in exopolysaccharide biosynthesis/Zn-dependent protease with chaperone function